MRSRGPTGVPKDGAAGLVEGVEDAAGQAEEYRARPGERPRLPPVEPRGEQEARHTQTEGGDAACVDRPLDAGVERRAQQIAGSCDIGAEHRRRIGNPEAVVGGDMKQIPAPGNGARERLRVLHRALGDFNRKTDEVATVAVRAGEDTNPVVGIQQRARNCRPDKPGRSGDEAQAWRECHQRPGSFTPVGYREIAYSPEAGFLQRAPDGSGACLT